MRPIRLRLADIERAANERPPGYREAVLQAGQIDGDWIELSEEAFAGLRRRFLPLGPKPTGPSLLEMAGNFAGVIMPWVTAGVPVLSEEGFQARRSACLVCPFWDHEAWGGHGRCLDCGCGELKPWLATTRCRQGRWPEG